jgi:acyl-CoA reductase-like NAD-dependent aldehyde dehydrogenase
MGLLPWESPVFDTISTLVPAILSGNSVLLKDHTSTPIFSRYFEKAIACEADGLV